MVSMAALIFEVLPVSKGTSSSVSWQLASLLFLSMRWAYTRSAAGVVGGMETNVSFNDFLAISIWDTPPTRASMLPEASSKNKMLTGAEGLTVVAAGSVALMFGGVVIGS